MEVDFADDRLDRLETDRDYNAGRPRSSRLSKAHVYHPGGPDERDFYALKSLHFEKLQGDRAHERSMRINKQWRLIVELRGHPK